MNAEAINVLGQEKDVVRRQFHVVLTFLGLVLAGGLTLALLYALKPKPIICEDQLQFIQAGMSKIRCNYVINMTKIIVGVIDS